MSRERVRNGYTSETDKTPSPWDGVFKSFTVEWSLSSQPVSENIRSFTLSVTASTLLLGTSGGCCPLYWLEPGSTTWTLGSGVNTDSWGGGVVSDGGVTDWRRFCGFGWVRTLCTLRSCRNNRLTSSSWRVSETVGKTSDLLSEPTKVVEGEGEGKWPQSQCDGDSERVGKVWGLDKGKSVRKEDYCRIAQNRVKPQTNNYLDLVTSAKWLQSVKIRDQKFISGFFIWSGVGLSVDVFRITNLITVDWGFTRKRREQTEGLNRQSKGVSLKVSLFLRSPWRPNESFFVPLILLYVVNSITISHSSVILLESPHDYRIKLFLLSFWVSWLIPSFRISVSTNFGKTCKINRSLTFLYRHVDYLFFLYFVVKVFTLCPFYFILTSLNLIAETTPKVLQTFGPLKQDLKYWFVPLPPYRYSLHSISRGRYTSHLSVKGLKRVDWHELGRVGQSRSSNDPQSLMSQLRTVLSYVDS